MRGEVRVVAVVRQSSAQSTMIWGNDAGAAAVCRRVTCSEGTGTSLLRRDSNRDEFPWKANALEPQIPREEGP